MSKADEVLKDMIENCERNIREMEELRARYSYPGFIYGDRIVTVNDFEIYYRDNGFALSPSKIGGNDSGKPGHLWITTDPEHGQKIGEYFAKELGWETLEVKDYNPRVWAEMKIKESQEMIERIKEYIQEKEH